MHCLCVMHQEGNVFQQLVNCLSMAICLVGNASRQARVKLSYVISMPDEWEAVTIMNEKYIPVHEDHRVLMGNPNIFL